MTSYLRFERDGELPVKVELPADGLFRGSRDLIANADRVVLETPEGEHVLKDRHGDA